MKYFILTLMVLVLSILSGCSTNKNQNTTAAIDEDKICKTEKIVGSHIGKRVCRTQAEVDRLEENSQELIKRTISKTNSKTWK